MEPKAVLWAHLYRKVRGSTLQEERAPMQCGGAHLCRKVRSFPSWGST